MTVRGKHKATNGAVMGGEETWEKLVQESWHINSGGVTSALAGGQGPLSHPPRGRSGSRDRGPGEGRVEGEMPHRPGRGGQSAEASAPKPRSEVPISREQWRGDVTLVRTSHPCLRGWCHPGASPVTGFAPRTTLRSPQLATGAEGPRPHVHIETNPEPPPPLPGDSIYHLEASGGSH